MIEGLQSSQARSTSVHDREKSRMYCYLPFLAYKCFISIIVPFKVPSQAEVSFPVFSHRH